MKPSHLLPVLCALMTPGTEAAVYINDAVILDYPPFGQSFTLSQSPNGFVLVEINKLSNAFQFEFVYRGIAGFYGLFSVTSGEELSYLNASSKPTLGGFGAGNTLTIGSGQNAYIGYWSQRTGKLASPTMEANDIFGWAKVSVSGGELVVTESASSDGGIIVGTQTVPEPSGPVLLGIGLTPFLLGRRRK
ncbi:MAG: PEP-CTERM sorting domain-containing protein [Luteolibacter sp.]|uniref:PEP-CTERM sorting domain-containing protein n=1 Tax=Luteolibacter sp. TaxID=1962973 RepID=UPI0032671D1D